MRRARHAPAEPAPSTYLRATQVAERLNVHRATVYKLAESGAIKSVRFGGSVRFLASSVEEFIAAAHARAGVSA